MRRISIVGVGLIGGSLGLAWKERRTDLCVTGWDRQPVLEEALRCGAIDRAAPSLAEAAREADAVVLAVPLDAMEDVLQGCAPHVRPGTLVTDVGSVKVEVLRAAERILPVTVPFIGGHPMAGAAEGSLAKADAFLFENATYVLCGQAASAPLLAVAHLVESLGARVIFMDAKQHDRVAACVSHVPQLVATTLMTVVGQRSGLDETYLRLAAGGFRDMTRIASSPFATWQPILEHNRAMVLEAMEEFRAIWQDLTTCIQEGEVDALAPNFDRARVVRTSIPRDFKGFLAPLCDVFVYAEDRPGTLTHITSTLYSHGINIKDIELLKIREGTGGAFRLSFVDEPAADAAITALSDAGCRAHRLT